MKKNMIALAIASAVAAPAAFADAPTVYGKANLALESNAEGTDTGMQVNSIASRFGVKGSTDLNTGLKAVYKYEFEVVPDKKTSFNNRNQYVGLAGGFGTVLMGRHDTPVKMSQPKDLFNDGIFDNNAMVSTMPNGEDRISNVLAYVSPDFGGVKLLVAGASDVEDGKKLAAAKDNSLTNITSVAATYGSKKKGLFLSAGVNTFDDVVGGKANNLTRVSAQYVVGHLLVNGMYQTADAGSNITINAGYGMGDLEPKLKYATNSESNNSGNTGSVWIVGVDYKLGKKTNAYIEYGSFDKAMGANSKVSAAQDTTQGISKYTIGLIHKF